MTDDRMVYRASQTSLRTRDTFFYREMRMLIEVRRTSWSAPNLFLGTGTVRLVGRIRERDY